MREGPKSHKEGVEVSQVTQARLQGKVKWFSDQKGYGFISRDNSADVFVHHTAIQMSGFRTLKEGDSVTYDLLESPKGLQAVNVTRAE
jgi:CspA family cold shock protein